MDKILEEKAGIENNKIKLTLLNGTGYLFEVEDYLTLRKKHRIVGALVGTCTTKGWSANDCTMPVELTKLETYLLVEQNIAVLVSKQLDLLKTQSVEEHTKYQEQFDLRLNQQSDALKDEKLKESERNLDKIIAGKRKKLLKQGLTDEEICLNPVEVLQEIRDTLTFERKNALLDIPCAHADPHVAFKVELPYPENYLLKYLVFRDFWLKGKYVTCGDAFGADFLIYPGDPLLYHASHIVILLANSKINPLDLVAKVRLSVIVNKHCVFAYLDDECKDESGKPKVRYQTALWEGNKDKER